MRFLKIVLIVAGLLLLAGLLFFFFGAAKMVDRQRNIIAPSGSRALSPDARVLHDSLLVADLHADNLLWDRDLLQRIDHGHVDLPRLIEGNVAVQVFDAVIKTPRGQNYLSNDDDTDNITYLAMANRWPPRTWSSLLERALYQADLLREAADRAGDRLTLIRSAGDLRNFLLRRYRDRQRVGGILSVEGLHALEGDVANVDRLYDAGYRILGLTHFFDNEVGGSSSGMEKGGLTGFGRDVILRMEELGLIVDLAHASPDLAEDVLRFVQRPPIVSHTGLQSVHANPRNLSDDQVRKIAALGGLIGIGFWDGAVGSTDVEAIVRTIRYAADLVGVDHVALGSDWDGSTSVSVTADQTIILTDALLRAGFSHEEVKMIMGGNQIRFLLEYLPD